MSRTITSGLCFRASSIPDFPPFAKILRILHGSNVDPLTLGLLGRHQ